MRFSDRELKDLVISWVLISIAFGILLYNNDISILSAVIVAAFSVGLGFIVHELSHKFTAQHYDKFAEFYANIPMLVFAIILSFTGLLIAAPGAVHISGFVNRKENGIIALAGPLSNVVLALLFLPLFYLVNSPFLKIIFGYGYYINSFLALFNMLPFGFFDGAKVFSWDKLAYGITVFVSLILVGVSSIVIG